MKPKRVLIIHPTTDYNSGDRLTFLGTKALLEKAVGGAQNLDVVQFDIERALREIETYVSQFAWGEIDIIALAGSPWIWIGCEKSTKYKLVIDAINRYPKAKKIALGLGSCFDFETHQNIQFEEKDKYFYVDEVRKMILHNIYSNFDYILVRDEFAKFLFDKIQIKSRYTYDTSLYSYHYIGKKKNIGNKSVLWFYDPTKGVSKSVLNFDPQEYIKYQIDWAKENNADIYCNCDGDKSTLMRLGVSGTFSVDLNFVSHKFQEYSKMLSGRVHMAVLGYLSGIKQIKLLPVDTRFMTTLKLGVQQKFIGRECQYEKIDLPPDLWENILEEEGRIVEELKRVIL